MKRTPQQWAGCDPAAMASQSPAAILFAFKDAKADINELYERLIEAEGLRTRIGAFTIQWIPEKYFWIENADGEGMQAPAADIEKLIATYFKANF